jgi:diacylglycerol kinase (ATP)
MTTETIRIAAIVNPISGAGADPAVAAQRVEMLRAEAERRGLAVDIHLTERGGHARELAESARAGGARLVVAWGGDGTINEVGSALLGSDIPLGIVPAGSGNGLAAVLAVPRRPLEAIAVALDGTERTIDAGMMAGRAFFNVAGVGLDARVAARFNERAAGSRGGWPYVVISVLEGCTYCAAAYDVELDGTMLRTHALLVSFANGREFGMGARIAPQALIDDGLLDATIVEERPLLARIWDARHLAFGTLSRAPRVRIQQVRHAVIRAQGEIEYHVDGECGVARDEIEVRILPAALRVKAPPETRTSAGTGLGSGRWR